MIGLVFMKLKIDLKIFIKVNLTDLSTRVICQLYSLTVEKYETGKKAENSVLVYYKAPY